MAAMRRNSTAGAVPPSRRSISFNASAIRRLSTTYARNSPDSLFRIAALSKHSTSSVPLYLFRAPGVQLRIGLQGESYLPGGTISGTVLIYRDGTAASTVRDVNVYLVSEIARRKANNAYDPSQEFRPQVLNHIPKYKYTHTLVPAAQKSWSAGPHEARFHSVTHPIRPLVRAGIPTFSNGDEVTSALNHLFSVTIPDDAPASRSWKEDAKRDAAIDLRYRLVAVVNLSQGETECTVMAETCVLVANGSGSAYASSSLNMGSGSIPSSSTSSYTSRTSSTFTSLYSSHSFRKPAKRKRSAAKHQQLNLVTHELMLDEKIFVRCAPPPAGNTTLILTERVTYMGKIRAERQVTGKESTMEPGTYVFTAAGLGVSLKEGPLSVSHYINSTRVDIYASPLSINNSSISNVSSGSYKYLVRNTRDIRRQPSIRFYYQDELPLFGNLDYRNRTVGTFIPSQRLSALTLASRLPHLTNTAGNEGTDCENEVCCLCLDDLHNQNVTRLRPCGHILHLSCAQLWLRHAAAEGRGAICCPMCKTVLR